MPPCLRVLTLAIGGCLLGMAALAPTTAAALDEAPPAASTGMSITLDARVPMRDGIALSARIWRPAGAGRRPVVLQHTPYLSDETQMRAGKFVAAGYVYVSLDRRGRGTSEGRFVPLEGRKYPSRVIRFCPKTLENQSF